ncbi:MAG: alpha/beta hydrolase [Candidatus Wildermuthbacteria bacterium]|nr:alpha/beta hydrolase [Candidatus Wildermuthbacteria bacterium]
MRREEKIAIGTQTISYTAVGDPPSARQGGSILILHGWGSSSNSWVGVGELLAAKGYCVIVPDLPGFGKTPAPLPRRSPTGEGGSAIWGVEEYAEFVNEFVEKLGLQKFILASHSFGGQVAIQFAVQHPEKVEKLVLIAAAAVRRTPGVFKSLVMAVAKIVSFLLYLVPFEDLRNNIKHAIYMLIRRRDYIRTQGIMRDIFKKVIMQDLTAKCPKLTVPTLIVWGDKDEMTPIQDAYLLQELIPNSKLEIIPGGKHALNFQVPEKLSQLIGQFAHFQPW